jgi:hypothetical protein
LGFKKEVKPMVKKETSGNVIRVYVSPVGKKSPSVPWVRFYRHPYGIKRAGEEHSEGINADRDKTRDELASEIGEMIIKLSPILQKALSE